MAKQEITGERNWYAIHTYVGYENAVLRNLKQRIESLGMEDRIFNVIIPMEKKIKVREGKRVETEEKIYPGYVLVEMIVDDESWYVVRNTPRVTGFLGSGTMPIPVSKMDMDDLMKRMELSEPEFQIDFEVGSAVKVVDGPFKGFDGKVSEIDQEKGKIKVLVNMFGRDTALELDSLQLKKIN